MTKYEILTTLEFDDWENSQTKKEQFQIDNRLDLIASEGHFGDHKSVSDDDSIWELRWANGRRVYYSYLPRSHVVILLGGNKNGQKKTSQEPITSSQKEEVIEGFTGVKRWSPTKRLLNKRFVLEAVTECLLDGDAEGAWEVVQTYLKAVNRAGLAREAHVSRSTMEHCLQHGNPTIKTVFRLLSA